MSFWPIVIFAGMLFVAYANGANDNFKGVATLFGGGVAGYEPVIPLFARVQVDRGYACSSAWSSAPILDSR